MAQVFLRGFGLCCRLTAIMTNQDVRIERGRFGVKLILAQVYNRMTKRHGAIHPTCRSCFDATGRRWAEDETLSLRLDEVIASEAKADSQYRPDECFYCGSLSKSVAKSDGKLRYPFVLHYRDGGSRSGVVYAEGNVQMDDGELFSRLDQLVSGKVCMIGFGG